MNDNQNTNIKDSFYLKHFFNEKIISKDFKILTRYKRDEILFKEKNKKIQKIYAHILTSET